MSPLPRRFVGGATLALSLAVHPSFGQAPGVGELKLLAGDDPIGPAAGVQEEPSIAASDTGFLVVWADLRTDFTSLGISIEQQTGFDILGARLDADGSLLDLIPFPIGQQFGTQENPQVAWNGENWLVVWENQSPTTFFYASEILAVRVAPDGTVLDDPPISVIDYQSSSSTMSTLTANGSDWLVVAQGTSAGEGGLMGVRIAADGTVLDPGGVTLVPSTFFLYFNLGLSSAQGEYLLTYEASGSFEARRFQSDLTPIGGVFGLPSGFVGSNGSSYYLVWTSGSLVGSPMALDGTLQVPGGAFLAPSASTSLGVEVTWDGATWWTSWQSSILNVMLARISPAGTVLDPGGVTYDPVPGEDMREHALAGSPAGGVELVWKDDRLGGFNANDVFSAPISADVVPGPDVPVSVGAPAQRFPDLAAGGDGYLTVFLSETSGMRRLMAQRLDDFGNALDPEPFEVAASPALGLPHVAWNGSLFLVVWSDDGNVFGRRVAADGSFVDGAAFVVMDGFSPDVSALGDVFLVVGTRITISSHFIHPFAMRVDGTTGALLDPAPILLGQYFARVPSVTTVGNRWLAVWQRNVSHDDPFARIYAAFVEADGNAGGEFYLGIGGQPDVAASDGTVLFVWRTGTDSSSDHDIVALRMLPDGTFPDGTGAMVVSGAADKQMQPSVVWTGGEFLLAWEDMRNALYFFDERTDVYGARVSEAGAVLDPAGFPIVDTDLPSVRPVLGAADGKSVFAGSLYEDDAPFAAYRVGLCVLGEWTGLGKALAGTNGFPVLDGSGAPSTGSIVQLHVANALPNTFGAHVIGLSQADLPFFGGVMVPSQGLLLLFTTDAGGVADTQKLVTQSLPAGLPVFVQSWMRDLGAVQGLAASNAITTLTQ